MQAYGQADSKATKDRLLTKLTTASNLPYFPNCEKFMRNSFGFTETGAIMPSKQ